MNPPAALQFDRLSDFVVFEHAAMATTFTFHLRGTEGTDTAALRGAAAEAFRLIDRLEDLLSFYREGSDVSRINRAAPGETLPVHEATIACLLTALEVAAASEGAFDPFAGAPALTAKGQPIPLHLRDRDATDGPGTPCVAVDPERCTLTRLEGRRWLDLGGIGKGFALDAAAELLPTWDVAAGLLIAGGSSVVAFGSGGGAGGAWPLRLTGPEGARALELPAPFGLAASGEGFQPGHIIRPRPATAGGPLRTYALAPSGAIADALSTTLWALPDESRLTVARGWPEVSVLIEQARAPGEPVRRAGATGVFAAVRPQAPQCLLVIPCWREARRLPRFLPTLCEAVDRADLPVEILVVDDGSEASEVAATRQLVEHWRERYALLRPLLTCPEHAGKGAAIRRGWQEAPPDCAWLAFVDADGSIPASDVVRLLARATATKDDSCLIAATRRHQDPAHPVRRRFDRAMVGAVFARWSRFRLRHAAADPQCGCKVAPAGFVRAAVLRENGYMLDLELLLAARRAGLPVDNVPVSWHETPGSKLRVSDLFSMLQSIERLRITAPASLAPPASTSLTPP